MLGRSARNTQYFAVCVILSVGCKPREPVYDTDVDLGTEHQPLLPADMYHVYGEELLRGRANDPDLSHLVPPEPDREPEEAEAGATVDPEIQALVKHHNQLLQVRHPWPTHHLNLDA